MSQDNNEQYDYYQGKGAGPFWHEQLDHAKGAFDTWKKRGEKVVRRYRDERDALERLRSKFNILWSNIQVLKPSLYGRPAKPEVSRRYMDSDPVGRLASTILERVLDYEIQQFPDFECAMDGAVEDRLLPGRGQVWMRYEPVIVSETMQAPEGVEITNNEDMTVERIAQAHAPVDYVYWKDFIHSPARTWAEVWWVARWVYMTREEGLERFGEVFNNVPLDEYKEDDQPRQGKKTVNGTINQKAKVAEIWNKRSGKVCWVAADYPDALDERDDPLELEGFFPCPEPMFATLTTGTLIPVPDYTEYQDQAEELDSITGRITTLVKAVKAVGVFNAEFKELTRLLTEGQDNKLFPVTNWAALAEKNGLKGAVDMLDISIVLQALGALYTAREQVKQTIYEICGISDILRGTTKAEETLGAQQLKANFGSLRLRKSQTDVARFASDVFKLKAQIICKYYPPELLIQMSAIQGTSDGQDPRMLQAALQMLSQANMRDFHIAVESDSLAQLDDQAEKEAASEAITAIGGFVERSMPMVAQAPETLPMVSEMLLFLVRRFRAGRGLESAIEQAMKALQMKAAQAAANPQPSKEQVEAQLRQQEAQMRAQVDTQAAQMKAQFDAQTQQGKLQQEMQLEQMKSAQDMQLAKIEGQIKLAQVNVEDQFKRWSEELKAATSIQVALIGAQTTTDTTDKQIALKKEEVGITPAQSKMDELGQQVNEFMAELTKPKPATKKVIRRDGQGRAVEVVTVPADPVN